MVSNTCIICVKLLNCGVFAAIIQRKMAKTLHSNDGEKVVDQIQNYNSRNESGHQNNSHSKNISKSFLHTEQSQQPEKEKKTCQNHMSHLVSITLGKNVKLNSC